MPYKNLHVYQKAYQAALDIHKLSLHFPKLEQHELASQLRRSSKSIPANLAEGMGKQASAKEVKRFIQMAIGSCDESRVWLEFAKDLGYLDSATYQTHEQRYQEIGKMLRGLEKRYQAQT